MNSRITLIILLGIIILTVVLGAMLYPQLPANLVLHWNTAGQANGHINKIRGVAVFPTVLAILFILYWIIPKIDPLKANIGLFRKYYDGFWILLFVFFFYIDTMLLARNLGFQIDIRTAIVPALAILWFAAGIIVKHSQRNWFVGIRTPWTLSSDAVWKKTNQLGARLFQIAAIISLIGLFAGSYALWWAIAPVIIVAVITVVYSYVAYRGEKK